LSSIQEIFTNVASAIRLFAEISSVIIIGVGLGLALYFFVRTLLSKQKFQYIRFRLSLGKFLVVALEFQLAADIIGTAIAPTWQEIAIVAAVALVRTFLNYFLNLEIKNEEKQSKETEISQGTKTILEK
jgi:uncharacterized membrane protein